jgi:uncharacterized protein YecT (DUF1311 family)
MVRWLLLTVVALLAGPAAAHAPQAFDCSKATSRTEKRICADADLRGADTRLSETYRRRLRYAGTGEKPGILAAQRTWLVRRDRCVDKPCLLAAYDARSTELWREIDRRDRFLRRNLARVGQCENTAISSIGPRLGGGGRPDNSGTSVRFANGVQQVSYYLEKPVARSRLGDRARVCLVAIPHNCPPGDDRGRQYAVTNLRTGEKWRMYDSQHLCGGA